MESGLQICVDSPQGVEHNNLPCETIVFFSDHLKTVWKDIAGHFLNIPEHYSLNRIFTV